MNLAGLISVFGVAFLYFVGVDSGGLAQGLDPVVVVVTAAISYACGVGAGGAGRAARARLDHEALRRQRRRATPTARSAASGIATA